MAFRISLFLASLPTRSRALLRLRGRLVYKSRARRVPSPQCLPVLLPAVRACCFFQGIPVAVKMASTSRLVCAPDPGLVEGGRGVPGGRGAQEMRGAAAALAGRPAGQRLFPPAGLSGASLGLPSRRRSHPRVLDGRLTQAPPCGGSWVRSP